MLFGLNHFHNQIYKYYLSNVTDSLMWKYLNGLSDLFSKLTKYSEDHQETVKHLLKKPPGKRYD